MRLSYLDGFRGVFLFLMMTTHFSILFPAELQYLKYHYFGYVEDAQGFVFISGIAIGLAYGKRLMVYGKKSMFTAVWGRVKTIYIYQILLILIVGALALAFWDGTGRDAMFRPFIERPIEYPVAAAALVTAPPFAGILPLYIFLIIATPFILMALANGKEKSVLLVSILVWLFSQTMTMAFVLGELESWIATFGLYTELNDDFRVLAWQIIYVTGLCFGFRIAQGTLNLRHFQSADCQQVLPLVVIAAVLIAAMDMAENFGFAEYLSASYSGASNRNDLPIIYVASFAVDVYLVVWLFVAGGTSRYAAIRAISRALHWLVRLPFFITIGQHSIWVYSYHVVFLYVWALGAYFEGVGFLARNVIFLCAGLSLYPAALLEDRVRKMLLFRNSQTSLGSRVKTS